MKPKKGGSARDAPERRKQLYRPPSSRSADGPYFLLRKKELSDQDVVDYLQGRLDYSPPKLTNDEEKFYQRRAQARQWAALIDSGGAQIDQDQRLVPVRDDAPVGPLPPLPQLDAPAAAAAPADPNQDADAVAPLLVAGLPLENEFDEERRRTEGEEREAAEAIARAVKRYREEGVAEEDFFLVKIAPQTSNIVTLTFRRICIAVLAVVTAFVCIMLQTFPLLNSVTPSDPIFDKVMTELLHVRHFHEHVVHCPDLNRDNTGDWSDIAAGKAPAINCADGVLHIPPAHVIADHLIRTETEALAMSLHPHMKGINKSWTLPCHIPTEEWNNSISCSPRCFRGVHDGIVQLDEIESALELAKSLIREGHDHFDIHEPDVVLQALPSVVDKIKGLLATEYNVSEVQPSASRMYVALPMDVAGVTTEKSSKLLFKTFNRTNYLDWLEKTKQINQEALYTPFAKVKRDTCNLMADLDADPHFQIQTSIFLSDGAGRDYQGGVSLFADHHKSNLNNPRRKIRRGVTIDGVRGRVVVNTGGRENLRCRLPTRAGIRAVLQIWWECNPTLAYQPTCAIQTELGAEQKCNNEGASYG